MVEGGGHLVTPASEGMSDEAEDRGNMISKSPPKLFSKPILNVHLVI